MDMPFVLVPPNTILHTIIYTIVRRVLGIGETCQACTDASVWGTPTGSKRYEDLAIKAHLRLWYKNLGCAEDCPFAADKIDWR
jgi:hypothetical protein